MNAKQKRSLSSNYLTILIAYHNINHNITMYCTIISALVTLFILYGLIAYIRRKTTKPDYTGKNVWITGASSGIG